MSENSSMIAVYETRADGEIGIRELQRAAFNMKELSALGKQEPSEPDGIERSRSTIESLDYESTGNSVSNGCASLLEESASFVVPEIGPLFIAGPLALGFTWEGSADEATSALAAILCKAGIPEGNVAHYESELKADKFLLIARGTPPEVMQAKDVLHITRPIEISIHFAVEPFLIDPLRNGFDPGKGVKSPPRIVRLRTRAC
jgi:hypothetical protein